MSSICSFSVFSCNQKRTTIDFRTPKNKNYSISPRDKLSDSKFGSKCNEILYHDYLHSITNSTVDYPFLKQRFFQFNTSKGGSLVITFIRNYSKKNGTNTLIFSHDYKTTLGDNYAFILDTATQLKCNIISYDYSGYGCSLGIPSIKEANRNLEEVITFTQEVINIHIEDIILFSLGLGSQPTLNFASQLRKNYNQIKGIILYSPYLNEELVSEIEISNIICPVFFINGQKNKYSDYNITKEYTKYFKKITEWYPKKGNFDNLHIQFRYKFYTKIKSFLSTLNQISSSTNLKLKQNNYYVNNIGNVYMEESYVNKAQPIINQEPNEEDSQNNKFTLINENISTKEDENNNRKPFIIENKEESNPFSILRNTIEYNKFDSCNGDSLL